MSTAFSLPSFAKVNLSLRILGKRPDGYHEVRTLLQTVSLHDTLRFENYNGSSILFACDDPLIPANQSNLVVRAATALRDRFGIKTGASISLEKRIPAGGGLGGGSSNAAVALLGLSHLWQVSARTEVSEIAARLGADVPFFLHGGRMLATGIGTRISPVEYPKAQHLLIVAPKASVSTSEAYKALQARALTTRNSASILAVSRGEANLAISDQGPLCDDLVNDFEQVIFDIEPEIERAKNALLQAGARGALLCGSGSSVFGIFDNWEAQQRAREDIHTESGWRIFPCVTLSHEGYFQAMGSCGTKLLRSFDLRFDTGA